MANAQNIDKIFAELAKKVQREVQINLPRKVGIIAKNHFTDNFRKGGFVDSSLEPWQTTMKQQLGISKSDDNTIIIPLYYHNNTIKLPLRMVF